MDIVFKGRHTSVQERFRQHATVKLARIGKLDQRAFRVDVEVSQENNPRQNRRRERVELTITSRGPAIRAEAAADDRFTALDLALDKLESRLRRACDRRKARHAGHAARPPAEAPPATARTALAAGARAAANGDATASSRTSPGPQAQPGRLPVTAPAADGARPRGAAADDDVVPIEMDGDGPLVVRQKFHAAIPMTIDQALFEMELVGHDFYLFRDRQTGHSSVVYRRRGYQYGVIRLVEERLPQRAERLAAS